MTRRLTTRFANFGISLLMLFARGFHRRRGAGR